MGVSNVMELWNDKGAWMLVSMASSESWTLVWGFWGGGGVGVVSIWWGRGRGRCYGSKLVYLHNKGLVYMWMTLLAYEAYAIIPR